MGRGIDRRSDAARRESLAAFAAVRPLLEDPVLGQVAGRRLSRRRIRGASDDQRAMLGRQFMAIYRRRTGRTGPIDWEAFVAWCRAHWPELVATKILVAVLFLFCL